MSALLNMLQNRILLALFFATSLFACGPKNENLAPASDYSANVVLFENDGSLTGNNSGLSITANKEGLTNSTITDATGFFVLKNLLHGTHTFTYSGPNFPTIIVKDIVHDDTPKNIAVFPISKLPDFSVSKLEAINDINNTYSLKITSSNTAKRYVTFFFSKNSSVSTTDYAFRSSWPINNGNFTIGQIGANPLKDKGFAVGDKVYVRAYPSTLHLGNYLDPITSKEVFPALGSTSAVSSFTLQ
jgi:hypothetical protein